MQADISHMPEVSQDQPGDQGSAGSSQRKLCPSRQRDHDLCQDDPQHDRQGKGTKPHLIHNKQLLFFLQSIVTHILGCLKPGPFRRHIRL